MGDNARRMKTPEEKYEESAIELAAYRLMLDERDKINSNISAEEKREIDEVADRSLPHMLEFIARQESAMRRRFQFRKQGLAIMKTAAMMVLVLNMGLTIAAAASSTVRMKVVEFLTAVNESYLSMGFEETGTVVDVPEGWTENYYPTYIPDGYHVAQCIVSKGVSKMNFSNEEEQSIKVEIYKNTASTNVNVEQAEISYASIHDVTAIVIHQPYEAVDIIWSNGDRYFNVQAPDYDVAFAVAQSIEIVK